MIYEIKFRLERMEKRRIRNSMGINGQEDNGYKPLFLWFVGVINDLGSQ